MSIQNLLNQFLGAGTAASTAGTATQGIGRTLSQLSNQLPSGLAGGAVAGGLVALLMGSKSARKFAGSAATYGGAAVLGGLAYKAYQNWLQNSSVPAAAPAGTQTLPADESAFVSGTALSPEFQLTLIKALIAAARADGHIDAAEQQRIFQAVQDMDLTTEMKGLLFDLLRQPISVAELAEGIDSMEQKTELYLTSCLVIDPDHPAERAHLEQLAQALQLPRELAQQLQGQARQLMMQAA